MAGPLDSFASRHSPPGEGRQRRQRAGFVEFCIVYLLWSEICLQRIDQAFCGRHLRDGMDRQPEPTHGLRSL